MRKLIDDDGNGRGKGLGADIDLLMKSSRNVPKNSSFLKRDLVKKALILKPYIFSVKLGASSFSARNRVCKKSIGKLIPDYGWLILRRLKIIIMFPSLIVQ